jgi:magnesium transporter
MDVAGPRSMMNDTDRLLEAMKNLAQGSADGRDHALLDEAHPADLAAALHELPLADQVSVLRALPQDRAAELLPELDDEALLDLVRALDEVEVSRILDEMPAEDAADVVDELPDEEAEKVLELMQEEKFRRGPGDPRVSGALRGPAHVPRLRGRQRARDGGAGLEHLRKSVSEERAFELYVVDDHGHLVGVVPLRRLLTAQAVGPVFALREDVVSVRPEMDQEEVARLVAKYDLVAVPVVDHRQQLVGTITVDDVIDIVGEETSEDIFRMAGSDAAELERRSPGRSPSSACPGCSPPSSSSCARAWSSTTSIRR